MWDRPLSATPFRRTVPILPNLRAWLDLAVSKLAERDAAAKDGGAPSGPVCPFSNVTDQIVSLLTKINHKRAESHTKGAKGAKGSSQSQVAESQPASAEATARRNSSDEVEEFRWKHNGLRHSFISYRVAAIKNVAQVALEAGNSPAMIFSNYRELVTPQDAKGWFAIVPPKAKVLADGHGRKAKVVAFPGKAAAA
jgi:hypothetical protein